MKHNLSVFPAMLSMLMLVGCSENKTPAVSATNTESASASSSAAAGDSARVSGEPCDIKLANIHFTKAVNGADTLAKVDANGRMAFRVGAKKDFFSDPNDNKLSNNTAPILLAKVDNTKPFTLVSKVIPGFTEKGLYNAGVLYIYVNDNFWQKHCFEQDERGNHRIVSVRTIGTSDDNNHDVVRGPSAYMKISSDTRTVASYYSLDKKNWQLVRLYKNNYPAEIWMGVSAQCPVDTGTVSHFEEISLTENSVKDFRLGI
jgi:regulation of enolase protein 1 (concanavalin A-like superfamily)